MNLRHFLPISINYKIRHFFEFINQKIPFVDERNLSAKKRVFFLDTPKYCNIGDQAIALAMKKYINDIFPEYGQIEITEDILPQSIKWVKKNIKKGDFICLTGGGNMGTLYQRYEAVRRLIIRTFKEYPIVIFPQTFDYDNSTYSQKELKKAIKIYTSCNNLILSARDGKSYMRMKEVFPDKKIIFCPDMVLYLDYRNITERGNSAGICLRNDKEKYISENYSDAIKANYPNYCHISTTECAEKISEMNRKEIVENFLKTFAKNSVVITDRLHGVIFSYITDTPCIALPNSNGKVENVCNYLKKTGKVVFCKHEEDLQKITFKNGTNLILKENFNELTTNIKEIIKYNGTY